MTSIKSLPVESSVGDEKTLPSVAYLKYFLASNSYAGDLRRLFPALYLTQCRVNRRLYNYHLARGHVVSDELVEEIAQLQATGVLELDKGCIRLTASFLTSASELRSRIADQLKDILDPLIQEEPATLEAAATHAFFVLEGIGDPASGLSWFRALSDEVTTKANRLAEAAGAG